VQLTSNESNSAKIDPTVWTREVSKIWGHKNRKILKIMQRVIFHPFAGMPHWGDCFEFWHVGWYRQRNHSRQIIC